MLNIPPLSFPFSVEKAITGLAAATAVFALAGCGASKPPLPEKPKEITFNEHIAPIIYRECTSCHQEGQAGPFNLVSFEDVSKRAAQIAKVTASGFMPPWLPEHGYGSFADERRLTPGEIEMIQRWAVEGAKEGSPENRKEPPIRKPGWTLGEPDLVVTMREEFTLAAGGKDVYRNFVVPLPLDQSRRIRAVEFQPNTKAIHHLFILVDRTRNARRLDQNDSDPGFPGMSLPPSVESPGGYFLSWQPGRAPVESEPGMAWTLPAGSDLVLQMHMQPTGKPEPIQSSIGFYFTDEVPTNAPFKLALSSYAIDIPPGESGFQATDSYVLPTDLSVLAVLPHAHYLGKQLYGYAVLPSGATNWLLRIEDWDFNWQSAYQYKEPVRLPKGARLVMDFRYDNSTNNRRNPNSPPERVMYGLNSTDEMAGLVFQMLAPSPTALMTFQNDYQKHTLQDVIRFNTLMLARDPNNAHALVQFGKTWLIRGNYPRAKSLFERAVQVDPSQDEGHYHLGVVAMEIKEYHEAVRHFRRTLEINPDYVKARNNLGLILMSMRHFDEAERQFRAALEVSPEDEYVLSNLELLAAERKKRL